MERGTPRQSKRRKGAFQSFHSLLAWFKITPHIAFVKQNLLLNSFVGVLTLLGYIVPLPPSRKEAPEILSVSERSRWNGARLARAGVTEYFHAFLPIPPRLPLGPPTDL